MGATIQDGGTRERKAMLTKSIHFPYFCFWSIFQGKVES